MHAQSNANQATARIIGLGHYYPRRVVTNAELAPLLGTEGSTVDQQILGKIEVTARHWADETETVAYMATQAAGMALEMAGIAPNTIDLLIVGNWTQRQFFPEHAPQIAMLLGASNALAFDVCGACAGFVHGMQTAWMYMQSERWQRAIVIGCDQFSQRIRPGSRGQIIVGDAAGAVVLERAPLSAAGLIDSLVYSDGRLAELTQAPAPNGWIKSRPQLIQHAIDSSVQVIKELLQRNGLEIADIAWVVPHPGTDRVHAGIRECAGISEQQFMVNFHQRGNTGCASIPIVLSEFYHNGQFQANELFMTPAVGGGWFYGGLLFRL